MSPSEYQELTSFFVEHLGRHQTSVAEQLARHQASVAEQLARHQASVAERFDRQEQQTRALGVTVESLRHEIRLVADGVLTNRRLIEANGACIEENTARIEANGARIEANGARIDALTQRVEGLEVTVSARLDDHEDRLRVLE